MKLIDGLKLKGKPVGIPECSRNDLPEFFVEMGYKVGAEVGVYKGAFTEKFCEVGLKMYAIDPWISYKGAGRTQQDQVRQDFLYGHTQRTLALFKDCTIIRAPSMDALKQFKDGSLDFVYLDGDHSFRYIAEDLVEWSKKVRSGGAVSGHDYFCTAPQATNLVCHVKPVLDAYIQVMGIESLYVFGEIAGAKEKDNRYPSWMFLKP